MFVNYHILRLGETLPPLPDNILYEYVFMRGGVSIRARRRELSVLLPVNHYDHQFPLPKLGSAKHYVHMQKLPAWVLMESFHHCMEAVPNEWLGWVLMEDDGEYRLAIPEQLASPTNVQPLDPYHPDGARAFIDVHSHHQMSPFFSRVDDRDEKGFRISAVFGNLPIQPSILVRIGVFGHFCYVPYTTVFWKVDGLRDMFYEYYDGNRKFGPATDALEEGEPL